VSRLFVQCGVLNISLPFEPPRPVPGTAVFSYMYICYIKRCVSTIRSKVFDWNCFNISMLDVDVGPDWYKRSWLFVDSFDLRPNCMMNDILERFLNVVVLIHSAYYLRISLE
jgi:hypothetical protein